jgi:predicted ABC-type transport system involved in lysophospholipase L1 biosynthesis ATPase subunit
MEPGEPLVELRAVSKDYRGLRPLRITRLELRQGQSLALLGFDRATAEVLVNLVTGAVLPDAGDVRVMGRSTASIADPEDWVTTLDQFGLLSERAVLLDQLTAEQNLAMPLSLALDDLPDDVRVRAKGLASEVGLADADLKKPVAALPAIALLRVRLGRALALDPRVLLAEHPNASLSREDALTFAADLARVVAGRRIALLVITADETFARAVSRQVLMLQPATGELKRGGWRSWFS